MKHSRVVFGICLIAVATLFMAGCSTTYSVPMAACTQKPNEPVQVFNKVWFNGTGGFHWSFPFGFCTAYETTGQLFIFNDSMEFRKSNGTGFEMRNIRNVSFLCLNMTAFDQTKWVSVEYGLAPNSRTVYFADGSALGWGGVKGGTAAICDAIKAQHMESSLK